MQLLVLQNFNLEMKGYQLENNTYMHTHTHNLFFKNGTVGLELCYIPVKSPTVGKQKLFPYFLSCCT